MHESCAKKWFPSRIQIMFTQDSGGEEVESDVVLDRWKPTATALCEVCNHPVSSDFARCIMKSVDLPAIQKLLGHIVRYEPISLKFAKVPGLRIVTPMPTKDLKGGRGGRDYTVWDRKSYQHAGRRFLFGNRRAGRQLSPRKEATVVHFGGAR